MKLKDLLPEDEVVVVSIRLPNIFEEDDLDGILVDSIKWTGREFMYNNNGFSPELDVYRHEWDSDNHLSCWIHGGLEWKRGSSKRECRYYGQVHE